MSEVSSMLQGQVCKPTVSNFLAIDLGTGT